LFAADFAAALAEMVALDRAKTEPTLTEARTMALARIRLLRLIPDANCDTARPI